MNMKNGKNSLIIDNMKQENEMSSRKPYYKKILVELRKTTRLLCLIMTCLLSANVEQTCGMKIEEASKSEFGEIANSYFGVLKNRGNLIVYSSENGEVVLSSFDQVQRLDEFSATVSHKAEHVFRLRPLDCILLIGSSTDIVFSHEGISRILWKGTYLDNLEQALNDEDLRYYAIHSAVQYTRIIIETLRPDIDDTGITDPVHITILHDHSSQDMSHIWERARELDPEMQKWLLLCGERRGDMAGVGKNAKSIARTLKIDEQRVKNALGWWEKAMHTEIQMVAIHSCSAPITIMLRRKAGGHLLSWLQPCASSCYQMMTLRPEAVPFLGDFYYYNHDKTGKK